MLVSALILVMVVIETFTQVYQIMVDTMDMVWVKNRDNVSWAVGLHYNYNSVVRHLSLNATDGGDTVGETLVNIDN